MKFSCSIKQWGLKHTNFFIQIIDSIEHYLYLTHASGVYLPALLSSSVIISDICEPCREHARLVSHVHVNGRLEISTQSRAHVSPIDRYRLVMQD